RTKVTGRGGSSWPGAATTTRSANSRARVRTVWTINGSPSKGSRALGRPMRELLPPARITAEAGGWGLGVGGWYFMGVGICFYVSVPDPELSLFPQPPNPNPQPPFSQPQSPTP